MDCVLASFLVYFSWLLLVLLSILNTIHGKTRLLWLIEFHCGTLICFGFVAQDVAERYVKFYLLSGGSFYRLRKLMVNHAINCEKILTMKNFLIIKISIKIRSVF